MRVPDGPGPPACTVPVCFSRRVDLSIIRFVLLFGAILLVVVPESTAQARSEAPRSRFSIGGLAGRTSGLSIRVLLTDESMRSGPFEERAVDVNASFNLDGYVYVTAHVTAERPVENSPLTFHIGPGWLAGADDGEAFFGPSGNIGVYFTMARYQVVMQLMPGLTVTPNVNGEIGAAVGMRVAF